MFSSGRLVGPKPEDAGKREKTPVRQAFNAFCNGENVLEKFPRSCMIRFIGFSTGEWNRYEKPRNTSALDKKDGCKTVIFCAVHQVYTPGADAL